MEDNPTSLKQIFQGMQTSELSLVEGAVIQAAPLLIKLTNDNLELNENVLVVPRFLTNWQAECDISENNFQHSKGSIKIYNSLKKGEKVMLLSYNNGKKYCVLDRV